MADPQTLLRLDDTRFASEALLLGDPDAPHLTFISKATFDLEAGASAVRAEVQQPIAGADVPVDPEAETESAVRYESDLVPFKPLADALCVGKAHAPGGHSTTQFPIRFGVGPFRKEIRVVGDRHWSSGLAGVAHFQSRPQPFVSMPVHFGRAYGGSDVGKPDRHHARNRVGVGYSKYGVGVSGAALPNLEDPREPIRSWRNRPEPMSFGPVGRTWQPRLARAGTYDKQWLKLRAPRPPTDFDERFYNCAPDDQQIPGYLRGDETVTALNLHAVHPNFACRLPGVRVRCFLDRPGERGRELAELPLALDTLWVDMEALRTVLVWRGRVAPAAAAGSTAYLMVEERLDSVPRDAQSYLPTFESQLAEQSDAWADAELADAERALEEATQPDPVDA
jgi:hypothetical protein